MFSVLCLEAPAWRGVECQPAAPTGAALGCTWLHKCFRQQELHFCVVSLKIPEDKLSCKTARLQDRKTARKHYLSTEESHRGACTLCLELGHTVRFKIGTELVLLRELTSSVHCWFSSWRVSNITHATLLFHGNPHPLLSEYKPKVHIFQGIVWITFLILITFLHFFLHQPSFGY